jgi:hypothetical protein
VEEEGTLLHWMCTAQDGDILHRRDLHTYCIVGRDRRSPQRGSGHLVSCPQPRDLSPSPLLSFLAPSAQTSLATSVPTGDCPLPQFTPTCLVYPAGHSVPSIAPRPGCSAMQTLMTEAQSDPQAATPSPMRTTGIPNPN